MSRKNKPLAPAVVVPTDSLTEVWAVTTYGTECHADDCYCDTGEGTTVVALFSSSRPPPSSLTARTMVRSMVRTEHRNSLCTPR